MNVEFSSQDLLKILSQITSSYVTGYLKNGRWYLHVERYFAYFQPIQIKWYAENSTPGGSNYQSVKVELNVDVDDHFLRGSLDDVGRRIRKALEDQSEIEFRKLKK